MESELEKLCNLWESLERQLERKVFDLSALEERLVKSGIDVRILSYNACKRFLKGQCYLES